MEVLSDGTAARDRGIKFDDYQAHGVTEYWIVDPDNQTIEQHHLIHGRYELALKAAEGSIRSVAVPGFAMPIRAAFDVATNRQVMTRLATGGAPD